MTTETPPFPNLDAFIERYHDEGCEIQDPPQGVCVECNIPMMIEGFEYVCSSCGRCEFRENQIDRCDSAQSIRINRGKNIQYYNLAPDYSKLQRKIIADFFEARQKISRVHIPRSIIADVIDIYNNIQKTAVIHDFMTPVAGELPDAELIGPSRRFVRRGEVKNEILAALIYYQCNKKGLIRKKHAIAEFVGLKTDGFAKGEDILRGLYSSGAISINIDDADKIIVGTVNRYLARLGLDDEWYTSRYRDFVCELVELSEIQKIGMNSQISSKVIGALWVLVLNFHPNIQIREFEESVDGTKKNTFNKFCKNIFQYMDIFKPVFEKYDIPLKAPAEIVRPTRRSAASPAPAAKAETSTAATV